MLYHISKLHRDEQELVKKAPLLVSILVAGADGEVDDAEIERTVSLIHTKAFSETSDIRHLYKEIDHDVELKLKEILSQLPKEMVEREKVLTEELKGLNVIFTKLESHLAIDLYKSLKNFGLRVAQTSGGVFGMNTVKYHEGEMAKLPMLNDPAQH